MIYVTISSARHLRKLRFVKITEDQFLAQKWSFYLTTLLLYLGLWLRDVFRLLLVKNALSDHIVNLEGQNYIIDQEWLAGIKKEVRDAYESNYYQKDGRVEVNVQEITPSIFNDSVQNNEIEFRLSVDPEVTERMKLLDTKN